MKIAFRLVAGLFILFQVVPASSATVATQPPRQLSLEEYQAELSRIQKDAATLKENPDAAVTVFESIADQYEVSADGRKFVVDNKALKLAIGEYKVASKDRRRALLEAIQSRVAILNAGAEQFHAASDLNARKKLEEILARREFRAAKGPGVLEIWWQKAQDWIARMFDKIFGKLPSPQSRNDTLAWILIAISLSVLAVWIKRMAERREPESVRIPIPFAPSEKSWRTWLAEAKAASGEGRWRDAVHLAYWAGISNLEEHGAWIPDRARTPREYLQLSFAHPLHNELAALTSRFEVIWYGKGDAEASDFNEAVRHLEALGCR